MSVTGERFRLAELVRRTPRLIWMLAGVQLLLGVFYALAVPPLHGPDEHSHVDLVNTLAADEAYPAPGGLALSDGTVAALGEVGLLPVGWRVAYEQPWRGLGRDDVPPRDQRAGWEQLGGPGRSELPNHVTTHPPLYYTGVAATAIVAQDLVRPAGAAWPWDRQVGFLRLLNVLLLAPLPLLAFHTAVRLTASDTVATAAAAFPLAIPQLSHLAGSVNNDNLLILLVGALTLALAYVATGDLSVRTAVKVGVLAGLAIVTKGFGLAGPAWVALAYAIGAHRGQAARAAGRALAVAAGVTVSAGGWWELRLLAREGAVLQGESLDPTAPGFVPDLAWWVWFFVRRMAQKFWGFFGIEQVALPSVMIAAATLLTLAAIALAWQRQAWTHPVAPRADPLLLLAPVATTLGLVVLGAWTNYARTGMTTGVQGRYLFVGIVGIAVTVAAGASAVVPRRWLPLAVLGAAAVMQVAGTYRVVGEYWAGSNPVAALRTVLYWSPWPPVAVALSWLVLGVLAVACLVAVARWEPAAGGPSALERPGRL